jgi:hypothetical protein
LLDLAAQNTELVAQNRDLDVLGVLAAGASEQHADESARHKVEEGQAIGRLSLDPILAAQRTRAGFLNPTGLDTQLRPMSRLLVPHGPRRRRPMALLLGILRG